MYTPEEIKKALQDGIDAGKHDATPGNLFRSAWPAAKDYGYHGLLRDIFTAGYLSELPPDGVLVDSNSVVVGGPQYQQPAERKDYGANNTTNTGPDGLLPALS